MICGENIAEIEFEASSLPSTLLLISVLKIPTLKRVSFIGGSKIESTQILRILRGLISETCHQSRIMDFTRSGISHHPEEQDLRRIISLGKSVNLDILV